MSSRSVAPPLAVTIVAANPETIDGLQSYLGGAGVSSTATRALGGPEMVSVATTACVIFPDDLRVDDVVATVASLRAAHPRLLILFVTSAPQSLGRALLPDDRSLTPLVLPKPAFGWTILDAVRAHTHRDPS